MPPASERFEPGPHITGSMHPATVKGFTEMLVDANNAHAHGYDLMGFERIDTKLGIKLAAVYKRRREIREAEASLVG